MARGEKVDILEKKIANVEEKRTASNRRKKAVWKRQKSGLKIELVVRVKY